MWAGRVLVTSADLSQCTKSIKRPTSLSKLYLSNNPASVAIGKEQT